MLKLKPREQTIATVGLSLALAACLFAVLLAFALQVLVRPSTLPEGYVVHACFGSTSGRAQIGVWWLSPYTRDAPRWAFVSPTSTSCRFIPWLPFLPQFGNVTLPP